MKIGDIFYEFRGESRQLIIDAKKAGEQAGAAGAGTFGSRFRTAMTTGDFASFVKSGFGLAAGLAIFGAVTGAIKGVADIMGDAVRAAAEEQVGIAQLTASLEANVEGWDGNRDAIEEVITARERLAFNDDEQRQSMALLVAATKDVTEAQELQAIAMDLSRLRGTALVETTTLIGKVYQGNLTALKRFGISLGNVKTSQEALTKIQQLARGQARAYADTVEGKQVRAQQALNNAMEDLGTVLTPIVAEMATWVADTLPAAVGWIGQLGSLMGSVGDILDPAAADYKRFRAAVAEAVAEQGGNVVTALEMLDAQHRLNEEQRLAADIATATQKTYDDYYTTQLLLITGTGTMADAEAFLATQEAEVADSMRDAAKQQADLAVSRVDTTRATEEADIEEDAYATSVVTTAKALIVATENSEKAEKALGSLGGAVDEAGDEFDTLPVAIRTASREVISGLAGLPDSMKDTIRSGRKTVQEAMTDLRWSMEHPFAGQKYVDFLKDKQEAAQRKLERALETGNVEAAKRAAALVDAIQVELDRLDDLDYDVSVNVDVYGRRRVGAAPGRAAGGPVAAHMPYWVGESGRRELFVPETSGHIIPEHAVASGPTVVEVRHTVTMEGAMALRQAGYDAGEVARMLRDAATTSTRRYRWTG